MSMKNFGCSIPPSLTWLYASANALVERIIKGADIPPREGQYKKITIDVSNANTKNVMLALARNSLSFALFMLVGIVLSDNRCSLAISASTRV